MAELTNPLPYQSTGYLLNRLAFSLSRQSDQILLERLGIGMSQYIIMHILQLQPSIQQRVIAKQLGQTEASISRQMKILANQSLLEVRTNPQNRREHVIILTIKGERIIDEANNILDEFHKSVFEKIGDKNYKNFAELISTYSGLAH
jgi:DNA-binding MarR family transcriptional regulator